MDFNNAELRLIAKCINGYIDELPKADKPEGAEELLSKVNNAISDSQNNNSLTLDEKIELFNQGKLAGNDILDLACELIKGKKVDALKSQDRMINHLIEKGYIDKDGNILKKINQ